MAISNGVDVVNKWAHIMLVALARFGGLAVCGGTPVTPSDPGSASSWAADASLDELASECLDAWLNAVASRSVIDDGLVPVTDGQSVVQPLVTQNSDGSYHAHPVRGGFERWTINNEVTANIETDPKNAAMTAWLNALINLAPDQDAIQDGLVPRSDGQSANLRPILTRDQNGFYWVDPTAPGFWQWCKDHNIPAYDIQNTIQTALDW